jgi:hypothetical protein
MKQIGTGNNDNTWGMLCHLSTLCLYLGVPLGNLLAPLLIWVFKKDDISIVDDQAKESLNFQISITIYGVISGILCLVFIGFVMLGILCVADIVLVIMATIKTYNGEPFRYPFTIRLIK